MALEVTNWWFTALMILSSLLLAEYPVHVAAVGPIQCRNQFQKVLNGKTFVIACMTEDQPNYYCPPENCHIGEKGNRVTAANSLDNIRFQGCLRYEARGAMSDKPVNLHSPTTVNYHRWAAFVDVWATSDTGEGGEFKCPLDGDYAHVNEYKPWCEKGCWEN